MKGFVYPVKLCLKVLEHCAKLAVKIFMVAYYDSIRQTVFTAKVFGECAKALNKVSPTRKQRVLNIIIQCRYFCLNYPPCRSYLLRAMLLPVTCVCVCVVHFP